MKKTKITGVLAAMAMAVFSSAVSAQGQYPNKTIVIVSPFAPGGSDIVVRVIAPVLSERLKQPVVIENKPGAGGLLGVRYVAAAKPDGYTLLFHSSSVTSNQAMQLHPDVDVRRDLTPITTAVFTLMGLFVNPSLPVHSVQELIAYGKANPGKINFGSLGIGSVTHLYSELFADSAGIKLVHIPYDSASAVLTATVTNELQFLVIDSGITKPFADAGKLRFLAVGSEKRSPRFPEIPAADEGLPNYQAEAWRGFFAPPGTPADIVERLYTEIRAIIERPDVNDQLTKQGYEVRALKPADFKSLVNSEVAKWDKVVTDAKIPRQ